MAHSLSAYFLPSPPPPWTAVATATYGLDPPSPLSPPPARSVYAGTQEPKAAASDEGGGARRRRNLQLYIPYPTLSCHTWLNLKRGLGNDPPPRRRRRRRFPPPTAAAAERPPSSPFSIASYRDRPFCLPTSPSSSPFSKSGVMVEEEGDGDGGYRLTFRRRKELSLLAGLSTFQFLPSIHSRLLGDEGRRGGRDHMRRRRRLAYTDHLLSPVHSEVKKEPLPSELNLSLVAKTYFTLPFLQQSLHTRAHRRERQLPAIKMEAARPSLAPTN